MDRPRGEHLDRKMHFPGAPKKLTQKSLYQGLRQVQGGNKEGASREEDCIDGAVGGPRLN